MAGRHRRPQRQRPRRRASTPTSAGSRISSGIGATTTPLGLISLSNDADGDAIPAILSNVGGNLTLVAAYRQNWFAPIASQGTVMTGANKVMVVGDWNRDGYVDTMAHEQATRKIWLYPGSAATVPAKKRIGGWTNLVRLLQHHRRGRLRRRWVARPDGQGIERRRLPLHRTRRCRVRRPLEGSLEPAQGSCHVRPRSLDRATAHPTWASGLAPVGCTCTRATVPVGSTTRS